MGGGLPSISEIEGKYDISCLLNLLLIANLKQSQVRIAVVEYHTAPFCNLNHHHAALWTNETIWSEHLPSIDSTSTSLSWPLNRRMIFPVETSHRKTCLSPPHDTSRPLSLRRQPSAFLRVQHGTRMQHQRRVTLSKLQLLFAATALLC